MHKFIDIIEFLLQCSFRNLLNFIIIKLLFYVLCVKCDDWALHQELFMYLWILTCSTSNDINMEYSIYEYEYKY
jgi:hypothetical protein